mgnify:FL=1
MSVKVGGKSFETLNDKIYVGDTQITKIYAGETLVYPTKDRYAFRIWYEWDPPVALTHGPEPVNQAGYYFNIPVTEVPFHRVAFFTRMAHYRGYYIEHISIFITLEGFGRFYSAKNYQAIAFSALDGKIVNDYFDQGGAVFNYYELIPVVHSSGKVYYKINTSANGVAFNAQRRSDKALIANEYTLTPGGDFNGLAVATFSGYSTAEAINFVLEE